MLVERIHQEFKAKNYTHAHLLIRAAKSGNLKACNLVGWALDNGVGIQKKDPTHALVWFDSCSNRNPIAAYNAGVMYFEARGTEANPDKGAASFETAWKIGGQGFHSKVPQIPIRLAYYYRQHKMNAQAWQWAETAAEVNDKHGKYLVALMLIDHTAPFSDDSRALGALTLSVESYNPAAAELLAWCYATGRLTDRNPMLAYEYELISIKMDPKRKNAKQLRWTGNLTDDEKAQGEGFAKNWLATHQPPKPMDFVSTLDGTEEQFRR